MGLRNFDPAYYHEISQRVNRGAFLFDPGDAELRDALCGVLATACARYGVRVLAFHFLTNHYHGLYAIDCPRQFNLFLAFLHAGFARAFHRLRGTSDKLWGYMTWNPVAKDEASVRRRLKYILGQATAAGLVQRPEQFAGASSLPWMLRAEPLCGVRFDATQRCRDRARLAGGARPDEAYCTPAPLTIAPPEVWSDLDPDQLHRRYREIADEISDEARLARELAAREASAGLEPATQAAGVGAQAQPLEALRTRTATVSAQRSVATPQAEGRDGGPYCAGKVKPKLPGGGFGRARRPQLLAADRAVVQAYEDRYAACCTAYRAAKAQWRAQAQGDEAAVVSPAISLPPYMLLGTLPLRLPGDRRALTPG